MLTAAGHEEAPEGQETSGAFLRPLYTCLHQGFNDSREGHFHSSPRRTNPASSGLRHPASPWWVSNALGPEKVSWQAAQ